MAKKCMQCGGSTKKMAKGGMPSTTPILGPPKKPFAAGIPFYTGAGQTGPSSMKKGGTVKKMQKGGDTSISVRKVSANDPYEVEKRRLQQAKLSAAKKRDLGIAAAKYKKELQDNKNLKLKTKLTGKMQVGGVTTKKAAFAPPTAEEQKYLRTVYDQRNKTTSPEGTEFVPSSENFRTRAGGFNVYPKPKEKTTAPIPTGMKRGGTKMQTGGTKMVSWMKDGLSKSTGKRRIVDSKVSMTGSDAPTGKTPMAQMGGSTVKARKTITGGTRVKTNNGENVTVTRRNKVGNITKQSARKAVKGWSEDDYKLGGATKAKKFAALAPPYNKATAADRITGAKKNAKKK
jgi:hypothetical protein